MSLKSSLFSKLLQSDLTVSDRAWRRDLRLYLWLVTVRCGYCLAKARLMLLRCAVLCHHVSDSRLSYFANWAYQHSYVSHLLLLLNASTPSTALDASVICDRGRIEVTGASVPALSAGLLQRYCRNSWHCDKTPAVGSEYRGSLSIRNNFPGPLSLLRSLQ